MAGPGGFFLRMKRAPLWLSCQISIRLYRQEKHMGVIGLLLTLRHPQSKLDCSGHTQSLWLRQVIAGQGFSQT